MKICGLLFVISLVAGEAYSQKPLPSDSTILYLGSQAYYAYIIPHRSNLRPLTQNANPWGISLELSRLRYTKSAWNACNCYSQNGLALIYFNFDNPEVLGSSINAAVFAEPHLTYKNFNMSLRAGLGLSFLTKVYHVDSNPENAFFSRTLSGLLLVQLTNRLWLNENFGVRLSAAYHHISNGGSKQPNLGMNFPTVSIGAEYSIGRIRLVPREKQYVTKKTMQYYAGLFFTTRKVPENETERKPVLGINAGFYKSFARMHGIGLEIEVVHDWSLKEQNKHSVEYLDHRIVSTLLRHHFLFGKFDFSQALGFYVYKRYPTDHNIFQRYFLEYHLTKNIQLGFSLKAHFVTAEQMDMRVSYLF